MRRVAVCRCPEVERSQTSRVGPRGRHGPAALPGPPRVCIYITTPVEALDDIGSDEGDGSRRSERRRASGLFLPGRGDRRRSRDPAATSADQKAMTR